MSFCQIVNYADPPMRFAPTAGRKWAVSIGGSILGQIEHNGLALAFHPTSNRNFTYQELKAIALRMITTCEECPTPCALI